MRKCGASNDCNNRNHHSQSESHRHLQIYHYISHFHIFWSYDPVLSFHMPYYKIYTQSSILNKQLLATISRDIKFLFWWKIWSNCAQSLKPFLWWLSLTKAKSITHTSEYFQTEQILSGCVLLPKEATFKQIDWVSFYAKMTLKLCKRLHHSRKGFIICELPLQMKEVLLYQPQIKDRKEQSDHAWIQTLILFW